MSSRLTASDLHIITHVAVFGGLKPETVLHIIAPATAVELKRHEMIMRQDDPATAFFIVIHGCVKLYRNNISGDETVIEVLTKGDSFAEFDRIHRKPIFSYCRSRHQNARWTHPR